MPEGPLGRSHLAKPTPVIRDDLPAGVLQPITDVAPAAPVTHARVKQDDRGPVARPVISDQHRVIGPNLQPLVRHGASV